MYGRHDVPSVPVSYFTQNRGNLCLCFSVIKAHQTKKYNLNYFPDYKL